MIKSFSCEKTEAVWLGKLSRRLPVDIQKVVRRKLRYLDAAESVGDLRVPPGNRLEALKGSYKGYYSIRINNQWRICFRFKDANAYDVEMIDYH